jgi:hypothetical protein
LHRTASPINTGYDVAGGRHHRQAGLGKAVLQGGGAFLVALALGLACFEVSYRGERAGGSDVVKMNPGAWLCKKSTSAAEPAA